MSPASHCFRVSFLLRERISNDFLFFLSRLKLPRRLQNEKGANELHTMHNLGRETKSIQNCQLLLPGSACISLLQEATVVHFSLVMFGSNRAAPIRQLIRFFLTITSQDNGSVSRKSIRFKSGENLVVSLCQWLHKTCKGTFMKDQFVAFSSILITNPIILRISDIVIYATLSGQKIWRLPHCHFFLNCSCALL